MASLAGWHHESERKKTATRVRDAAKTRFERGYVVGGRVYGYKNDRLPGVKGAARLAVNREQAEVVRRIFRMAAEGLGLSRISRQLNAEGVPGPQRLSDAEVGRLRVEGSRSRRTSGLLACGAHSDAPGRKPFCGSPLIAPTRGRKRVPSYVCAGYREKGKTFCTNQTGVPMTELHKGVIAAALVAELKAT